MDKLSIGFWEVEAEIEEEEQISLKLAADKIATEIGKAIAALKMDEPDWDVAKKAIEAAMKSYEGYAYGYAAPDEPRLKGRFEAALKAIEAKDAKTAIATLEKIKGSRYSKPKEKVKEPAEKERKQQAKAKEVEERITLAGAVKQMGGEYLLTLITPGEANGYTWPADVLERDHAVFANMTSFTNHERRDVMAARPGGRTIDDICGVTYEPRWADGAVLAKWRAMPPKGPWVAGMIEQIIGDREANLPVPDVGVSVDVSFAHQNGKVTRLMLGHSADIVFNAARGPGHGEAFARVANAVQDQMAGGEQDVEKKDKEKKEQELKLKQERAMLATMAEMVVDARVMELPGPAADRVRQQFAGVTVVDMEALDAAIKAEREYLASLVEDKVIKGMGASDDDDKDKVKRVRLGGATLKVGANPMERVQLAVDRWFDLPIEDSQGVPRLDLSQLYADLTGDVNITGRFDIAGARERTGLANITDTTFAGVVADSLNKVILDQWQRIAATGYEWWKKVVHEQDFHSVHEVEWVTYGGFGDLPELSAGQEYPEISITDLDTSEDTGDWVKPGGIISVPKETFDKGGKTGAFKNLPRALAVAEIRGLSAKVAAIFTGSAGLGPNLADGVALFNLASHMNLQTTALSFDGWTECVEDHWLQQEQESSKVMALAPWGILVPIQLKGLGIQVLSNEAEHDTTDRNINPYQYAAERVIPVPEFTDATDWASFVDPKAYPSIGVGYRYGRVPKIEAEPGGAGAYGMWTQDCMRWKAWWQYTVSVINYRGLQKRNVAG